MLGSYCWLGGKHFKLAPKVLHSQAHVVCREQTRSYFLAKYNSLSERIGAVDPISGSQQLMQLFEEHAAVGNEINQSSFAGNMQLKVADMRVFSELMGAMAASMRASAAALRGK